MKRWLFFLIIGYTLLAQSPSGGDWNKVCHVEKDPYGPPVLICVYEK